MDEQNEKQAEVENYPLDEAAIAFFADGRKAIDNINLKLNGGFELYLKQHQLKGNWRLAENGKELERMPEQVQAQP